MKSQNVKKITFIHFDGLHQKIPFRKLYGMTLTYFLDLKIFKCSYLDKVRVCAEISYATFRVYLSTDYTITNVVLHDLEMHF